MIILSNATPAPTPISALSHSSTMVIAGVFSGIIIDEIIISLIDYYNIIIILLYLIPLITLLWSLFKAILLSDIKIIIALSTISQIPYMFITLLNPILCFYHIVIHPLFKPILFLFAGSFIHIINNYQNNLQLKLTYQYIIIFLLVNNILILSISKETIINYNILFINSNILVLLSIIGTIFTFLYIIKILLYCFYL